MDKNNPKDPQRQADKENAVKRDDNADVEKAHKQADRDIANDAELSAHSPNDDLDEGESARLGENGNGLA
jgi:hypothetical protein